MKSINNQLVDYFNLFYQYQSPLPKYYQLVRHEWRRVEVISMGRRSRRTYMGLWNSNFAPVFTINRQIRINS